MIVKPLIIHVMMEKKIEKKYLLVAWTRNVGDGEVEVRMIPELHHEAQKHLFEGIAECRRKGGAALDRKIVLLENSGDFNLMTGHYGEGIRFLRAAALACLEADRARCDSIRLYDKFHEMIRRHGREDILMEKESVLLEELHQEQAQCRNMKKIA